MSGKWQWKKKTKEAESMLKCGWMNRKRDSTEEGNGRWQCERESGENDGLLWSLGAPLFCSETTGRRWLCWAAPWPSAAAPGCIMSTCLLSCSEDSGVLRVPDFLPSKALTDWHQTRLWSWHWYAHDAGMQTELDFNCLISITYLSSQPW